MQLFTHTRSAAPTVAVAVSLAVMSLGAAAVHFDAMEDHFNEYVWFGVFFAFIAWLQALWAVAIVASPTRAPLVGGLVGNLVVVAVWIVSRTSGFPFGPNPGVPEGASFVDIVATALELLIAAGCAALLLAWRGSRGRLLGWHMAIGVMAIALLAIPVTTAAIVPSEPGDTHPPATPHEENGG
jgi:hypothetical protein